MKSDLTELSQKDGKDLAYFERDQLVVLISKLYPSHLARHPDDDLTWENDWRNIVCVHLPTGQATWHIHDSELGYFTHLSMEKNHWDGHSNLVKYQRLLEIGFEGLKHGIKAVETTLKTAIQECLCEMDCYHLQNLFAIQECLCEMDCYHLQNLLFAAIQELGRYSLKFKEMQSKCQ